MCAPTWEGSNYEIHVFLPSGIRLQMLKHIFDDLNPVALAEKGGEGKKERKVLMSAAVT